MIKLGETFLYDDVTNIPFEVVPDDATNSSILGEYMRSAHGDVILSLEQPNT